MFGYPAPECSLCGAFYGDREKHQLFHDSLSATWQKAFRVDDETAERITGVPTAERNARLVALAETLDLAESQGAQEGS